DAAGARDRQDGARARLTERRAAGAAASAPVWERRPPGSCGTRAVWLRGSAGRVASEGRFDEALQLLVDRALGHLHLDAAPAEELDRVGAGLGAADDLAVPQQIADALQGLGRSTRFPERVVALFDERDSRERYVENKELLGGGEPVVDVGPLHRSD